jgi:hypothetical protein
MSAIPPIVIKFCSAAIAMCQIKTSLGSIEHLLRGLDLARGELSRGLRPSPQSIKSLRELVQVSRL